MMPRPTPPQNTAPTSNQQRAASDQHAPTSNQQQAASNQLHADGFPIDHDYPKPRRADIPHNLPRRIRRDIVIHICERVSAGEFLHHIAQEPKMPSVSTFRNWLREDTEFAQRYTEAQVERIEAHAANAMAAASAELPTVTDKKGNVRPDPAAAQRQRTLVQVFQWTAKTLQQAFTRAVAALQTPAPPMLSRYLYETQRAHQKRTGENLPTLDFYKAWQAENPPVVI